MTLAILDLGSGLTTTVPIVGRLTPRDRAELQFSMIVADVAPEQWKAYRLTGLVTGLKHRRAAAKAERHRAEALNAPIAEVRPSRAVELAGKAAQDAIDEYERLKGAKVKDKPAIRRALVLARETAAEYHRLKQQSEEARWRAFAEAEYQALAQARGEDVEYAETEVASFAVDENGNRILDRRGRPSLQIDTALTMVRQDGLDALLSAGDIDKNEYAAGDRYADLYEKADPERMLAPADPARVGGGSRVAYDPFGEAACKALHDRLEASDDVQAFELTFREAVWAHFSLDTARANRNAAESVVVLRAVVGKGLSIRQAVSGARKRARAKELLKIGLGALAEEMGLH